MKKLINKISLALFTFLLPLITFAQQGTGNNGGSSGIGNNGGTSGIGDESQVVIENPISVDSINGFILKVLEGAIKLAIPVIVLAVIYSGFLFVSAQGNPEKLSQAKKTLLYTIIGAVILLGSYAIAELISGTVTGLRAS